MSLSPEDRALVARTCGELAACVTDLGRGVSLSQDELRNLLDAARAEGQRQGAPATFPRSIGAVSPPCWQCGGSGLLLRGDKMGFVECECGRATKPDDGPIRTAEAIRGCGDFGETIDVRAINPWLFMVTGASEGARWRILERRARGVQILFED